MMPTDPFEGLIHYPLQLRPGVFVFLYLPPRLTREDVERLVQYLEMLALEAS